jgi:hypothetical protein
MPNKHHIEVEGRELTISNVEKVYFAASGFTKGQVISFYHEIAELGAYIQQNPTEAVFMAVGVGFVLSRRLWK